MFPVRITVLTPTGKEIYDPDSCTHLKEENKSLFIYDGSTIVKEYPEDAWTAYDVQEIIPEIEEYTGPGFPE